MDTAAQALLPESVAADEGGRTPFEQQWVTLTRSAYIELCAQAHSYKSLHQRAVKRIEDLKRQLQALRADSAKREATLLADLDAAQAMIRDLQHRLYAGKNDRLRPDRHPGRKATPPRSRGQQRGTRGHGRRSESALPARQAFIDLKNAHCPVCGGALEDFPGTEDSEVVEIEVKAYRRVMHRRRYRCTCACGALPRIVTAPAVPRLIARGKYGLSVWVTVLLDKYVYGRPSQRLLQDLAQLGIRMSAGTLAGGLKMLLPFLAPLDAALREKLRSESHWHADETRWPVFVERQGKLGHRWCLWAFRSASVVHYLVDPTRSAKVLEAELDGVSQGVLSCDRLSAYKAFARRHPGIKLAWCWAHQQRDFLNLAIAHPELEAWALYWIERIGALYHARTLQDEWAQSALLLDMSFERDQQLDDPTLPEAARKVLQSMRAHWEGLTRFAADPALPMDNNAAERVIRTAVVGRKNFYGSGSEWSATLAAMMYSLAMTAQVWRLNVRSWLSQYLQACAENGNRVPASLEPFLPWQMTASRLETMRSGVPQVPPFDTS